MEAIHRRCAGMDVHKQTVAVCVRRLSRGDRVRTEVKTYGTLTRDILALADWLDAEKVTHVAMESTGVFWKPLYNILEGRFKVLLVNARHVKHVPGRKTDVKDCEWLAQLLQCGLLQASFVPAKPQRELRDLTRHRSQLVAERTRVANRIRKILEDANIKLGSVIAKILCMSSRDMIQAITAGQKDIEEIAELARGRLRTKKAELRLALEGAPTDHHRFMLRSLMDHLAYLESQIDLFSARIEKASKPYAAAMRKIAKLPGFDERSAQNVIAEIGPDMNQFPTAAHLASWTGICPGSNESAGKRKSGKSTNGNHWLRAALTQSAWAASRKKNCYFRAQYHRIVRRRGKKRALVAVAHSLLVVIYHVLKTGKNYKELGEDFFDRLDAGRIRRHHVRRLEKLGYAVTLAPSQHAA